MGFVSPAQINFQMPFEIPAGVSPDLVVSNAGVPSAAFKVTLSDYATGVFVYPRTGLGHRSDRGASEHQHFGDTG